ncbi:MAG: TraR/DksA family transcriptional regulator [Ferruginibacter sp.]|nr:TraR/DksA family transcriptional regulator [Bacteroidota bacterium]MBX2918977.1 TraR/DksA family transcriptional regulator [Ferruginibacter sp.]
MATKKKAAKPAAKKTVKPVKKAAPKKPAAKKTVAQKPAAKPVAKKSAKQVKKAPKKAVVVKKAVKPVAKAASKKPVAKPMKKKVEVKKTATKPVAVKKESVKTAIPVKSKSPEKAKDIKITPAKAVVLPKISTKTSRKYQPEFTKSILDQPKHDLGAPIVRYSDAELAEFRDIILRKLESAKKELAYLQGLITRKDEMGGDNDDARYMTMEDGSMSMEREQLSQMASRQITFIDHLEKAIMRIENKTYGICRVTGQLIDKARLRAVPHATLSMEAKMGAMK